MSPEEFKDKLISELVPHDYKNVISDGIPDDWLVLQKGSYLLVCLPFSTIEPMDYGHKTVKDILKRRFRAFPFFNEKGVFVIYYGDVEKWRDEYSNFQVDKTGLRPIIIQAVHFFDLRTGENINTRTAWGPVKFGFSGSVIEKIEGIGRTI